MREPKKVIVLKNHAPDCRAIQPQNWPDNPLWFPGGMDYERRDAAGRRLPEGRFGYSYMRFECNCPSCDAAVLVLYGEVTKLAHELMVAALKGETR